MPFDSATDPPNGTSDRRYASFDKQQHRALDTAASTCFAGGSRYDRLRNLSAGSGPRGTNACAGDAGRTIADGFGR